MFFVFFLVAVSFQLGGYVFLYKAWKQKKEQLTLRSTLNAGRQRLNMHIDIFK